MVFLSTPFPDPVNEPTGTWTTWNNLEPWEARIDAAAARLHPSLVKIRRHLHAHPEPSGEEFETTKFVLHHLREAGLEPRLGRNEAGEQVGAMADLTLGHPPPDSPLIAVRCDLDALRMPDEKTVEYASRNPGVAHACGHDAHTAILLGLALASTGSAPGQNQRPGSGGVRLRLLFQPAEETSEGARWMVEQGALDGVDAVLGYHVDPERPVGRVGVRYGILTANCDEVRMLVEGHGGHAARPHHSVDPVAVAAHLVTTLHEFLPRSVDSRNPSVFTVGRIAGGYASNVIPERVELHGTLRTTDPQSHGLLRTRIEEIGAGLEQSSGARIRVQFPRTLKSVHNDPRIAAALESASQRVLGRENTVLIERPSMGGEDFAVYLEQVPGALLRLGCARPDDAAPPFLHSPIFDLDERALACGVRVLFRTALLLAFEGQSAHRPTVGG